MRFTSLDALRGIAALLVVIYHFQHLAAFGQDPYTWTVALSTLPFYALLKPIYLNGWMAVDLFFVISGFVFAWLYTKPIREHEIGAYRFFVLRLTRLYPLHALTLLVVAGLQFAYHARMGTFFVIPYNDAYHFLLNATFLQSWGLEKGPSFNGPSWSISVEILLYLLFFVACRLAIAWPKRALLAVIVLGLAFQGGSPVIGRGIAGYFAGVLIYHVFSACAGRADARALAGWSLAATGILWGVSLALSYADAITAAGEAVGRPEIAVFAAKLGQRSFMTLVFPLTVFALAMAETSMTVRWRAAAFLGEISYSSYLVHFPLQLVFANFAAYGYVSAAAIRSPASLILFSVILVPLSWAAYRFFELPMQRQGRQFLLARHSRLA